MVEFWYLDPFPRFRKKMITLTVFILAFLGVFQHCLCQNTQYQNGYNFPQNLGRQVNSAGQQVDANGNPITGAGQGQPVTGQQPAMQPTTPTTGNMPAMGGNQIPPQNTMNPQFPQQNQGGFGGPNTQPQFPQNQGGGFGGPNTQPQFPQNQGGGFGGPNTQPQFIPNQNNQNLGPNQYSPNQYIGPGQQHPPNQYPGQNYPNPSYPNQYPGGHGVHYPEAPHDLHLTPEGEYAYGYIMHEIASMLNNPTSRNNLFYFFNNLQMEMSNPKSGPIIQEFFNRWSRAVDTPIGQTGTYQANVVVQNPASSFLDTLKRKGNTLFNLAKDVTLAKTKALNSLFDDSIFSPAVQIGTNWVNAGMQGVQGTVTPLIGNTPTTNGQILPVTTPLITTTPQVTVQA